MPKTIKTIDRGALEHVAGGASRVTARSSSSSDQLTAMLTQITSSIQSLATNKNQSDPMQMIMMMMMMGGLGGGGGSAAAAAPPVAAATAAPTINIDTSVLGGGGWGWRRGGGSKKGW